MAKAVIFDMFETLVTLWGRKPYMGREIACELGLSEAKFREIWDKTENDRTIGKRHFEDVLQEIMIVNNCYDETLFNRIVTKRIKSKVDCFDDLHENIIPMLEGLKRNGIKIGLITNCFWEEYSVIKKSQLYKYFDVVCMSCEIGIKKPDERIFRLCLDKLELEPQDCIYCGDGGSKELETAKALGMEPIQALWYLKDGSGQPATKKPEFLGAEDPLCLVDLSK